MKVMKIEQYQAVNEQDNSIMTIQTVTDILENSDGSVESVKTEYFTPLPIITSKGIQFGLKQIENVTSVFQAFSKVPEIQDVHSKALQEQYTQAMLAAPATPNESAKLQLVQD